ncbi:16S rRNA (guanine(966)-N(2))-methyltransferase RsmD [Vaginisenegalia massiliensis]|uniref:16S rRNA (guanine(966)-N(2))-methyltransferase RsmD n=1 Tax=Vaginisenegalia massiliensis TaxID=2058294 RepID=UPI000F521AB0|nr:16S rRNA (guanine(966)-N(2))-methyltransferase RsmD [Vaginisenegalia massiliensis]
MRVISGEFGSRPLQAVPGQNTRPTTDKIKEGMFNLLGGYFDGGICLDFYAGSGALAIEAVSRGMDRAVLTEKYRPAINTIEKNLAMTKQEAKFDLLIGQNRSALASYIQQHPTCQFDLVFLDPPYKNQQIINDIDWLNNLGVLSSTCRILCETDAQTNLEDSFDGWTKVKFKVYGQTNVHLYERVNENE